LYPVPTPPTLPLDSLPRGMFGSAGVPTRPAGYTGDGSRADSGIPPAASRQLHSLTHTPSWVNRQLPHGSSTHSLSQVAKVGGGGTPTRQTTVDTLHAAKVEQSCACSIA
jgi:hypothetical protein